MFTNPNFVVMLVAALLPTAAHAQAKGWSSWKPDRADESRLDEDELRAKVPDIDFEPVPPAIWIVPYAGLKMPFQPFGAGAWLSLYPTSWLRVGLDYSVGISPTPGKVTPSHYAEGFVGLRFAGLEGKKEVDLVLDGRRHDETV